MNENTGSTARWIGLTLILGGFLAFVGYGVHSLLTDAEAPTIIKFAVLALYGGLAVLLLLALRQRLVERRTDKYRDIEI